MDVLDPDGGAPGNRIAAMHDYYRKTRDVAWRVRASASRDLQASNAHLTKKIKGQCQKESSIMINLKME